MSERWFNRGDSKTKIGVCAVANYMPKFAYRNVVFLSWLAQSVSILLAFHWTLTNFTC